MSPLISEATFDAFPIACVIAFAGLCALGMGWQLIGWAMNWRRFCKACGGEKSARNVLEAAEETAKVQKDAAS